MRFLFSMLCVTAVIAECVITGYIIFKNKFSSQINYVHCLIISIVTILSYLVSINTSVYLINSIASSVYFISIDWMLIVFIKLIAQITKTKLNRFHKIITVTNVIYAVFDTVILLINPFKEIAIHYISTGNSIYIWQYDPMILYQMHLIFCYLLIIETVWGLIAKICRTPKLYKSRYSLIILGIVIIVILNCVFLYVPVFSVFNFDISVLLYVLEFILIYYNSNFYTENKLLKEAPRIVIDGLTNPVVMFDYEKQFAMSNHAAQLFVPADKHDLTLNQYIDILGIKEKIQDTESETSFQIPYQNRIYRCDYQIIRKSKVIVGYVFLFTEASTEYDLLTGFHTAAAASRDYKNAENTGIMPAGVLICDINRLSNINSVYGRTTGDRVITLSADAITSSCPYGTYFVRLQDAHMMAVVPNTNVQQMKSIELIITAKLKEERILPEGIQMQYGLAMLTHSQSNIQKVISSALYSIKVKKMMDPGSTHSSLIFSLARVLQEADPGTEQHVMRTRSLGEELAQRLNLTDEDSASLSMLCLLHDIGKLGVPLEILNKPGKLTRQEWLLLQSHVEKGYQIAKASDELEPLANLILHHHESWDGSGYPSGLSKEEIPLLSRMIAIIDAYDAMTNDRPYRRRISCHAALKELERNAGKKFDPYIVSVFSDMIRESQTYLKEDAAADDEKPQSIISWEEHHPLPPNETSEKNNSLAPIAFSRYILSTSDDIILSVDEHFEGLTGYTSQDVETGLMTQSMLIFPQDIEQYDIMRRDMLEKDKEAFIEHRLRMKDGSCRNVFCHGWPYFDSSVKESRVQIIIADLTESVTLKDMVSREKEIAGHNLAMWKESMRLDPLTGIFNRAAYRGELQTELLKDRRTCVMLMCDLDHFKYFNDTYGHLKGDNLLRGFAKILTDNISHNGLVCRMGGDEFSAVVFFEKSAAEADMYSHIMSLWKNLDADLAQYDKKLSVSMGAAYSIGKAKNFDQLYKEADDALYEAKEQGRRRMIAAWNS